MSTSWLWCAVQEEKKKNNNVVKQETIKKKNQRQVCLTHEGDVFQLNIEQPANLRCLLIDKLRAEELVDGESDVAGSCETENNNAGERGARAVAVDISNCIPTTTTTTTGLKLDKKKSRSEVNCIDAICFEYIGSSTMLPRSRQNPLHSGSSRRSLHPRRCAE